MTGLWHRKVHSRMKEMNTEYRTEGREPHILLAEAPYCMKKQVLIKIAASFSEQSLQSAVSTVPTHS